MSFPPAGMAGFYNLLLLTAKRQGKASIAAGTLGLIPDLVTFPFSVSLKNQHSVFKLC
jgi:hypothetical protein